MKQKLMTLLVLALGWALVAALPGAALGADDPAGEYRLTLAECLGMALENNLDLMSLKTAPLISEQQVEVNKAEFELLGWEPLSEAAECFKTLAHPARLRMIQMMLHDRYTVGKLVEGEARWTSATTHGISSIAARPIFSIIRLNPGPDVAVTNFC